MNLLDKLKNFLIEKGYKPGDKIATEMELAKHFNVSRGKIREAATALCQMGILDKKARRGTILKSLDPETVSDDLEFRFSLGNFNPADFQEARSAIESAVIPLAVKRMTPVNLQKLEDAVAEMEANLNNHEKADKADKEFHILLLEACGNQTLQTFGQVIQALFRKEYRKKYWTDERLKTAAEEHRLILQAIKDSDSALAVKILLNHFKYQ